MCICYFNVPQLFFCAAPEQRHSDAPDADAVGLGISFRKRLFLRNDCPEENRIARVPSAPPRQNLLDLFAI